MFHHSEIFMIIIPHHSSTLNAPYSRLAWGAAQFTSAICSSV